MDFAWSREVEDLRDRLTAFMDEHVYPNEAAYRHQVVQPGNREGAPSLLDELKAKARAQGLWNLFLADPHLGAGLSTLDYAPLAEIMGRSLFASEIFNCSAPDTGNMEILAAFGTEEQKTTWLRPLLDGKIRSCFAMTEPEVAGSDPTNIRASITREGDEYVIDGHKWWATGALDPRCRVAIVMGRTDPDADPHRRQSMLLVPMAAAGVEVVRGLPVFGFEDGHGHGEIRFHAVRVPASNLLGEEGAGFAIAQARLGPGRIHHCMRAMGMAERALELTCKRVQTRTAFGRPLADQGVIRDWIAEARIRIEGARLMVLKAAWMIDRVGAKQARTEIAAIKVAAARTASWVIDRAIQAHGGAGVSEDFPLAEMYAHARTLHIVDGADEVHKMTIARRELQRWEAGSAEAPAT